MTATNRERSVVVIELQGGNDALNTVIPYNNPLYYDFRSNVGIPEGEVLHLDGEVGFNPNLAPIKRLWDQGNVAVINGVGYPNPNRSHFRSRDVWYTCESEKIGAEGWLGAAIRDLDLDAERVNVHGGACALGHPIGASGTRIIVTLLGALRKHGGTRGVASLCIGGGEATAIGVELVS